MNIDITIHREFNDKIKILWLQFEKESFHHSFQKYNWIECWYKNIGKTKLNVSPLIIQVQLNNKNIMIIPFGIRSSYGVNLIEWLGQGQSDYNAPLYSKKIEIKDNEYIHLWDKILKKLPSYDLIKLLSQPKEINRDKKNFLFNLGKKVSEISYSLNLEKTNYKTFYNQFLKKSIRLDTERQKKRLKDRGELKFEIISGSENEKIFKILVSQKRKKYIHTGAFDIFQIKQYYNFYKELACNKDFFQFTHLSILKLDSNVIAAHFGTYSNNVFYYLIPSYDGDIYSKYSPGRILLLKLIEWCSQNGINKFDFTTGAEEYKSYWTNDRMELSNLYKINTIKGFLYLKFIFFIYFLKQKYKKSSILKKIITPKNPIIKFFM